MRGIKISYNLSDPCINYQGYKDKDGYGLTRVQGKTTRAHRASYMKAYGSIPNGLWILHKCDNPSCINPNHLYAGTPKQNLEDRKRGPKANGWKGPDHRGEKNTRAKLTLVDVEYIRQNRKYGMGKVLAEKYGVHVQTIRNIWRGALWK